MRTIGTGLVALLALSGISCGEGADEASLEREAMEAWDSADNPAFVDKTFEYRASALPLEGKAKNTPWSGDYWATARDSINIRWDGAESLSPAEKVAKAFNLADFPAWITENVGIYAHGNKMCDKSSDCTELKDGSSCVKPRGATGDLAGRCIPGWFGICHGWAPAAIAEPQPVKNVTKNGVTFYPGDLEGLASFAYQSGLATKFISDRCNVKDEDLNPSGRITNNECRDMNPGSMFIVLTNMLGLRQEGLVEDKTFDYQVWNQPVRAYRVTNAVNGKLKAINRWEAVKLLGSESRLEQVLGWYRYNPLALRFYHVKMEVDYLAESRPARAAHRPDDFTNTDTYEFLLEADLFGRIVGGEWLAGSLRDHPDFMWWPTAKPQGEQGGLTYTMVKELLDQAH